MWRLALGVAASVGPFAAGVAIGAGACYAYQRFRKHPVQEPKEEADLPVAISGAQEAARPAAGPAIHRVHSVSTEPLPFTTSAVNTAIHTSTTTPKGAWRMDITIPATLRPAAEGQLSGVWWVRPRMTARERVAPRPHPRRLHRPRVPTCHHSTLLHWRLSGRAGNFRARSCMVGGHLSLPQPAMTAEISAPWPHLTLSQMLCVFVRLALKIERAMGLSVSRPIVTPLPPRPSMAARPPRPLPGCRIFNRGGHGVRLLRGADLQRHEDINFFSPPDHPPINSSLAAWQEGVATNRDPGPASASCTAGGAPTCAARDCTARPHLQHACQMARVGRSCPLRSAPWRAGSAKRLDCRGLLWSLGRCTRPGGGWEVEVGCVK
ncbi:hypothetical protein WJX73_005966 [Symbiochloris irregularis]|uniref:Uncharacterized protein n=1 Tax=Symbiochloris irregularis TaxID=706552 RepID=A0AAW1PDQ8_9CHLO